ncbi:MAG: hypothetical protein IPF82_11625, partial [Blastocatellia bacterium]|nr:hypothetical protein [Blastocatellia bacterium]
NSRGQVVGVAVGSIEKGQNLNFAIPVSTVRNLLASAGKDVERIAASSVDGAWDVPVGLAPALTARVQAPSIIGERRSDESSDVASLRGLDGVYVGASLDDDARRYLNQDSVQLAVELELRRYNIKVLSKQQWLDSPWGQYALVELDVMELENGLLVYVVSCSLKQSATLNRDPTCPIPFLVRTWASADTFGAVGRNRAPDYLMKQVELKVGEFINAYLKAQ